jgi:energy-coupling factor transporter ATP-binding protein EcfA2
MEILAIAAAGAVLLGGAAAHHGIKCLQSKALSSIHFFVPPVKRLGGELPDAARIRKQKAGYARVLKMLGDSPVLPSLDADTERWIAVVGSRGAGKSTFINSLLGLKSGEGAAAVGSTETTADLRVYAVEDTKLRIFDFPGGGTSEHPGGSYFDDNALYLFSKVFFFTADDVPEFLLSCLREAEDYGVGGNFAVVRSKMDETVRNHVTDTDESDPVRAWTSVCTTIHRDFDRKRSKFPATCRDIELFLISNRAFAEEVAVQAFRMSPSDRRCDNAFDEERLYRCVWTGGVEAESANEPAATAAEPASAALTLAGISIRSFDGDNDLGTPSQFTPASPPRIGTRNGGNTGGNAAWSVASPARTPAPASPPAPTAAPRFQLRSTA